jgi:hypothetical protein
VLVNTVDQGAIEVEEETDVGAAHRSGPRQM